MSIEEAASRVGWGAYDRWEGPLHWGVQRFERTADGFWDKVLAVVCATEGGSFDAVNMYDRCIVTLGIVQWCGAAGLADELLGTLADHDGELLARYLRELGRDVRLARDGSGRARVFVGSAPVTTSDARRRLFLGGSTGLRGQWTAAQRSSARRVCSVFAAMLAEPAFTEAQLAFTRPRLVRFAYGEALADLFGADFVDDGWEGAIRAAYLSYAANLPAFALRTYRAVRSRAEWRDGDGRDRFVTLVRSLAFDSGIVIFPKRYDAIRSTIEAAFGVDVPDFASQLRAAALGPFADPVALQLALLQLGFDLGPRGVDGVIGAKTKTAIRAFQAARSLVVDGIVGPQTSRALERALKETS